MDTDGLVELTGGAVDPLENLGLSPDSRVLVLGDANGLLRPDPLLFRVTKRETGSLASELPDSFDAAIIVGCLEQEEWDRWTLQQVHRVLRGGGRMLLIVPNMLALCTVADLGDLAARAARILARLVAKALRQRPAVPGAFAGRRYLAVRLQAMLKDLDFSIRSWEAMGFGLFSPLAAVSPRVAQRHACRFHVVCEKHAGPLGLRAVGDYPDARVHREAYEIEHRHYLDIRDRWVADNPAAAPVAPGPLDISAHTGREVLVLAPHPDDEIIGCGGTLLLLIAAGARVTIFQATDGSASLALRGAAEPDRVTIRLNEARAVGAALGAVEVVCWGEDNRHFKLREERVDALRAWLEGHRPSLVLTPFVTDAHVDHFTLNRVFAEAIAKAAIDAAGTSVLGYEVWSLVPANRYCDISEVAASRNELLLLYPTAMKVDDFIHLCSHRNYYNAYTFMGREGLVEAFYETTADQWAGMLAMAGPPHD